MNITGFEFILFSFNFAINWRIINDIFCYRIIFLRPVPSFLRCCFTYCYYLYYIDFFVYFRRELHANPFIGFYIYNMGLMPNVSLIVFSSLNNLCGDITVISVMLDSSMRIFLFLYKTIIYPNLSSCWV